MTSHILINFQKVYVWMTSCCICFYYSSIFLWSLWLLIHKSICACMFVWVSCIILPTTRNFLYAKLLARNEIHETKKRKRQVMKFLEHSWCVSELLYNTSYMLVSKISAKKVYRCSYYENLLVLYVLCAIVHGSLPWLDTVLVVEYL